MWRRPRDGGEPAVGALTTPKAPLRQGPQRGA